MKNFILFTLLTILMSCSSSNKVQHDEHCSFYDKVNSTYNYLDIKSPISNYGYELLCAYDELEDSPSLKFVPDLKCTTMLKGKTMKDTLYQLDITKVSGKTLIIKANPLAKNEIKVLFIPLMDYETRKARNGSFSAFKLKDYNSYWVNVATILLNTCK